MLQELKHIISTHTLSTAMCNTLSLFFPVLYLKNEHFKSSNPLLSLKVHIQVIILKFSLIYT